MSNFSTCPETYFEYVQKYFLLLFQRSNVQFTSELSCFSMACNKLGRNLLNYSFLLKTLIREDTFVKSLTYSSVSDVEKLKNSENSQ